MLQFGLQQLLQRFVDPGSREVPDLVGQEGLGGELRAHFKAATSLSISVVIVGLERGDNWKICIPVKYGEALRLRVQRGIYQVTAWFFAAARAPVATLMLAGIAQAEIIVASSRAEKFVLMGQEPLPRQLAEIRSAAPAGRPFMLPGDEARMLPSGGKAVDLPKAPQLEIVSSPSCPHVDASGQRCSEWAQEEETYCARHSRRRQHENGDRMEIIGWVGTPPADVDQDSAHD